MTFNVIINGPESFWPFLFPIRSAFIAGAQAPWKDIIFVSIAGLVVALALVAIFLFKSFWRRQVTRTVKSIHVYGMNINQLERMRKTGLLTDEEYALIRQRQIARLQQEIELEKQKSAADKEERTSRKGDDIINKAGRSPRAVHEASASIPGEQRSADDFVEAQLREQIAAQSGEFPAIESDTPVGGVPPVQQSATHDAQPEKPVLAKRRKPIDVDDLLARGLITQQEYDQITRALEEGK